ncbi:MAG TPA: NAD(P)H-dependent oxidoreductase [Thermoleophilaceae bacterium]|nr:NAD(P)H-dependent oxidoreductase [Thermoleophilaceae bacterium]
MSTKALFLNCTLKPSPATSNTEALAQVVADELAKHDVESEFVRVVDHDVKPGVENDMGDGDGWPQILSKVLDAQILVVATPTWLGKPSSIAQRVLERLDALLSETDDEGRPVAYGKVAGVVVTGNEDGAHHVIAEVAGGLVDIGWTIPGQAWTYWNQGPGPGPEYLSDEGSGHEWSQTMARTAAQNLAAVASALEGDVIPPPPS